MTNNDESLAAIKVEIPYFMPAFRFRIFLELGGPFPISFLAREQFWVFGSWCGRKRYMLASEVGMMNQAHYVHGFRGGESVPFYPGLFTGLEELVR